MVLQRIKPVLERGANREWKDGLGKHLRCIHASLRVDHAFVWREPCVPVLRKNRNLRCKRGTTVTWDR
jgi:hypothetical protein